MCDIYQSTPWSCGERDCPVGWHLANYWTSDTDNGYTVDRYGDGDHEDIDFDDIPTLDEHDEAWKSYFQHVVDTGEDPLSELPVKTAITATYSWRLQLQKGINGVVICLASRNQRSLPPASLPREVLEYMHATVGPMNSVTVLIPWDELITFPEVTLNKRFPSICAVARFTLPVSRPRPASAIQRELGQAALARLPVRCE
jgi:hypothetical protein